MIKAYFRHFVYAAMYFVMIYMISCNRSEKDGNQNQNREELEQLAENYPDSIPLQITFWESKFRSGKKKEAIDRLLLLSERFPENTYLLNGIADLALQNADTVLALHFLNQSLNVLPLQYETEFRMAGLLQLKHDTLWERITKNLIQRKTDPIAVSRGHYLMGIHLANENKMSEAMQSFDSSISLNYTFTDAYIEKAIILLEKNQTDLAINLLYKAMELDRKSADIHFLIGECWMKKSNTAKALAFYEETLRLDPDHIAAQNRIDKIKP